MNRFSIINFIIFQTSWALAALLPAGAPFLMFGLLGIHFYFTPTWRADSLLLLSSLIGMIADQLMIWTGVLDVGQLWLPFWLILLWSHFTLCLNHSLSWLSKLNGYWLALLGAIFGTFSYWMGLDLEVFNTAYTTSTFLLSYACLWAILLPSLCFFAKWNRSQAS